MLPCLSLWVKVGIGIKFHRERLPNSTYSQYLLDEFALLQDQYESGFTFQDPPKILRIGESPIYIPDELILVVVYDDQMFDIFNV